jgi:hypothetical protein
MPVASGLIPIHRTLADGCLRQRGMDHFAGLDVSVKETSVCIVDDRCSRRRIQELLGLRSH